MRICVVGTGYVGLVTGTCLAETGNQVTCMDVDEAKIEGLAGGRLSIFEHGLREMVIRNLKQERLSFTADLAVAVADAEMVFIAVGTPSNSRGESDLTAVFAAVDAVAGAIQGNSIIVVKSTVPVGTCELLCDRIAGKIRFDFDVVSNPEFLREGTAVEDFFKPDRVIIGGENPAARSIVAEIYRSFVPVRTVILEMDSASAEMTKYVANAHLATRISFINEVANLCELLGADVDRVRQGIGLDRRIGRAFLSPGVGFGGSCFPKDLDALVGFADAHDYPLPLIGAVREVNNEQRKLLVRKMVAFYQPAGTEPRMSDKTFAVWGLAFKPQTDDMREAPSRVLIDELLALGARVRVYDPQAQENARRIFGDKIEYSATHYDAVRGADALVLVTEWNLFRNPDFNRIKSLLKTPVVFDGRNLYDPGELRNLGFHYVGIGRP